MARLDRSPEIDAALIQAVASPPRDLVSMVAARPGLSRQYVGMRAKALAGGGYQEKTGGAMRPRHSLGVNRSFQRRYPHDGLAEDEVGFRDSLPPSSDLPANVWDIAHHGVTGMINNTIDHPEAREVAVAMRLDEAQLRLSIADDGIGIFPKIARTLGLPDERLSSLPPSKGKLTTDPARHSGEGIFFTSRMFDRFGIHAGGVLFDHDHACDDDWLEWLHESIDEDGIRAEMEIERDGRRVMSGVFAECPSRPDDFAFARTVAPVGLARVGDEPLILRAQAKRLLEKVEGVRIVVLDFSGVTDIGQAFADEVFRVFANAHPAIELAAIHAAPAVQAMIRRAETLWDERNG